MIGFERKKNKLKIKQPPINKGQINFKQISGNSYHPPKKEIKTGL